MSSTKEKYPVTMIRNIVTLRMKAILKFRVVIDAEFFIISTTCPGGYPAGLETYFQKTNTYFLKINLLIP